MKKATLTVIGPSYVRPSKRNSATITAAYDYWQRFEKEHIPL